jgi:protein SCO1/2
MRKILITIAILAGFGLIALSVFMNKSNKPLRLLPIYGEYKVIKKDTIYHVVPEFSFIDQNNREITQDKFKGKIYVADYFFATCQSICPIMSKNMQKVFKDFESDPYVYFLSHTVNPEGDSVSVLKEYAELHGANHEKWFFVTGDKKELYKQARKGYYLDANEGDGGPDDFVHTPNFVLIDPDRHIRGYYDGTSDQDMIKLLAEIKLLKKEFEMN